MVTAGDSVQTTLSEVTYTLLTRGKHSKLKTSDYRQNATDQNVSYYVRAEIENRGIKNLLKIAAAFEIQLLIRKN